jgi:adenosylmethionine-8-amino-7-oxononanoate aminotransferase
MGGVELVADKKTKAPLPAGTGARVCAAMRPKGAMLRPLGNVIVLMPPPAIDIATLKTLLAIVEETIGEKSEVRSQKSGVRSQKSGVRSQKSEEGRLNSRFM